MAISDQLDPKFFKALCDPTRLAILARQLEDPRLCSVSSLAKDFDLDVSVISRHLALLRDAGILQANKIGREVCYTVNAENLARTFQDLADAVGSFSPKPRTKKDQTEKITIRYLNRGGIR
jgi:ArsR family transcriptional regulator